MNHYSSNTYNYSGASGVLLSEEWAEYKAEYKGFNDGYGNLPGKFRLGTKQVSPFILPNYGQNNYALLEVEKFMSKINPNIIRINNEEQ